MEAYADIEVKDQVLESPTFDTQVKSTHMVEVVPIKLYPHGNADTLSIVYPFGEDGYTCVVKTDEWKDRIVGAYIPPDSIVPDNETFAFLDGKRHIKVRKYRGIISQGLMHPAPEGSKVGDNVAEVLGVTHYNPAEPVGETSKGPVIRRKRSYPRSLKGWLRFLWYRTLRHFGYGYSNILGGDTEESSFNVPHYEVDSFYRFPHILSEGEEVVVHEKIDGSNGRWLELRGDKDSAYQLHAGSHYQWKKDNATNAWWSMYRKYPDLERFVVDHPGVVVFGEIYGVDIQGDADYGLTHGDIRLAVFDLWKDNTYLDYDQARLLVAGYPGIPWAKEVYRGPFNAKALLDLSVNLSSTTDVGNRSRPILAEGTIVRPVRERFHKRCGRVIFKIVSPEYLDRHDGRKTKKPK